MQKVHLCGDESKLVLTDRVMELLTYLECISQNLFHIMGTCIIQGNPYLFTINPFHYKVYTHTRRALSLCSEAQVGK